MQHPPHISNANINLQRRLAAMACRECRGTGHPQLQLRHDTVRLAISGDALEFIISACRWGRVCACGCLPIKNWMAISSAAAHPHLSHALQGDHDSSIPFLLPLIFSFSSGFVCGVLNFGEAISFALQWNLAR